MLKFSIKNNYNSYFIFSFFSIEYFELNSKSIDEILFFIYPFVVEENYIPVVYLLNFSIVLYIISILGLLFNQQKNIIVYMLFVELMLFSLSVSLISFSLIWENPQGQIFALFIMSLAVSESALGLGILIAAFRLNQKIEFDNFSYLKG